MQVTCAAAQPLTLVTVTPDWFIRSQWMGKGDTVSFQSYSTDCSPFPPTAVWLLDSSITMCLEITALALGVRSLVSQPLPYLDLVLQPEWWFMEVRYLICACICVFSMTHFSSKANQANAAPFACTNRASFSTLKLISFYPSLCMCMRGCLTKTIYPTVDSKNVSITKVLLNTVLRNKKCLTS